MHFRFKRGWQILSVLISLTCVNMAQAYDEDTHFYMTYAMARYAGIKHEAAAEMALNAQWMDESEHSSPLSITALDQYVVRYLFHFPGTKQSLNSASVQELQDLCSSERFYRDIYQAVRDQSKIGNVIDPIRGTILGHDLNVVTKDNHPMASEMIREGFEKGNLTMASAGLHVLQDSYSHAGHNALFGHAVEGHHADRPFMDWDKYKEMIRTFFKAMVAFRTLMPEDMIDTELSLLNDSNQKNFQQRSDVLAENFIQLLETKSRYRQSYLTNLTYVRAAVKYLLTQAMSGKDPLLFSTLNGLGSDTPPRVISQYENSPKDIEDNVNYLMSKIPLKGDMETEDVMKDFVQFILAEEACHNTVIINRDRILRPWGGDRVSDPEQVFARVKGQEEIIQLAIESLLAGNVPRKLDGKHKFEFEIEGPIREREMRMRIKAVQAFIKSLFNIKIRMLGIRGDRLSAKNLLANEFLVSKGEKEQAEWDLMIEEFKYPQTSKMSSDTDFSFSFFLPAMIVKNMSKAGNAIKKRAETIRESFCTHEIPNGRNIGYQNPTVFQELIDKGVFKMLLKPYDMELRSGWTYQQNSSFKKMKKWNPPQ